MKLTVLTYQCDNCGLCCTGTLIKCNSVDVMREPRLRECLRIVTEDGKITDEYLLNKPPDDPTPGCRFHTGSACSIYATRPNVCVGFVAGNPDCQLLRERAGLPPLPAIPQEVEEEYVCPVLIGGT